MGLYIRRNGDTALSPLVGPLTLILGITMMDMLLNATLTPMTWLTAGAILGHAERVMPRPARIPRHALQGGAALAPRNAPTGKRTAM